MKRLFFIAIVILMVYNQGKAQIKVNSSGNVAIGNVNPNSNKLYLKGTTQLQTGTTGGIYIDNTGYSNNPAIYGCANVGKSNQYCYAMYSSYYYGGSDLRQKENIRNISNSLNSVLMLNGVRFDFKNSPAIFNTITDAGQNNALIDSLRINHVGYIAQDVIDIIPEAVGYDEITDMYSIDYTKFIPFITEAIKEQQLIIQSLQSEIQELKMNSGSDSNLKSTASSTGITEIQANTDNILYQNFPNPFYQTTTIEYFLTASIQKAMICIYDMNGTQLQCIPLHLTGYGNITINGNQLKAGMYLYSLIADGKEIGTKRMILTE